MTVDDKKVREAISTLERARDEAIEKLAGGDVSYVTHLERAIKGIDLLRGML
jgi:hypothetical protein